MKLLCVLGASVVLSACGGGAQPGVTGVEYGNAGTASTGVRSTAVAPVVTMQDVRAQLERDEPNYAEAAHLGPGALPHLVILVRGDDPLIASKAVYLASLIRDPRALDLVEMAARSPHPAVRVAAAGALRNLAVIPDKLWEHLLRDPDVGVRKATLDAAAASRPAGVKGTVQDMARHDPDQDLRRRAREVADRLP